MAAERRAPKARQRDPSRRSRGLALGVDLMNKTRFNVRALETRFGLHSAWRSAAGHRGDVPRARPRRAASGAARHHRLAARRSRIANVIQHYADADADHRAQQDARRAALRRDARPVSRTTPSQYFVSYYDYYQPEAYIPTTDTFIEKDAIINDQIDRMRHAATHALLSRRDVIIVASRQLHLRHRLGRELPRAADRAREGRGAPARRAAARAWSTSSTSATTSTSTAAPSACAATWSRSSRPTRTRPRDPHRVLRRRGRGDQRGRSAARQGARASSSATRSSPARTTSRRSSRCARAIEAIRDELARPPRLLRQGRAASSRSSASSSARCTTSR